MSDQTPSTEALKNSSNPETLDRVISTTTPRLWLAFVGIVVALIAIIGWAFLSSIPVSVEDHGVVTVRGGYVVLPASVDGSVSFEDVQVDETVSEGQRIATLTPFDGSGPIGITAPIDGILTLIDVANGSGVRAGQTIAAVTGDATGRTVDVVAYVNPIDLPTYTEGQTVEVELAVDSDTAPVVTGVVTSVARVPTSVDNLRAQLVPIVAIAEVSSETYGLLYPVVIALDMGDGTETLEAGEIVTVINTYETIRPIDAIVSGSQ